MRVEIKIIENDRDQKIVLIDLGVDIGNPDDEDPKRLKESFMLVAERFFDEAMGMRGLIFR